MASQEFPICKPINPVVYHGVLATHCGWRARVWPSARRRRWRARVPRRPTRRGQPRAFDVDVLGCPRCGRRLRLIAMVAEVCSLALGGPYLWTNARSGRTPVTRWLSALYRGREGQEGGPGAVLRTGVVVSTVHCRSISSPLCPGVDHG